MGLRPALSIALASVLATLLPPTSALGAQQPASTSAAAREASRAIEARLSLAQLRRLRCVNSVFANCDGGLDVVHGFTLGVGRQRGDTVEFPVVFNLLGVVASSEAELMFMPAHRENAVDSGTVIMLRRSGRWSLRSLTRESEVPQTSASAARRFFQFPLEDRQLLDSAIAAHRRLR